MLRALITAMLALASSGVCAHERYDNPKYGIAFALPPNASACRSPPPLPNHGLLFRPAGVTSPPCDDDIESGARYTAVDARFDSDRRFAVADFAEVECPRLAYDSRGRVTTISPDISPGRLRWAACRIDGNDGSVREVLFARRSHTRGVPPIAYTITLKTTAADYPRDHAAFGRWLRSVHFKRPL